jgi:magnesium and cobalt transporter
MRQGTLSCVPVYEGRLDNIVGLVDARDLVAAACRDDPPADMGGLFGPVVFLPENARLARALEKLGSSGLRTAVAVDEYGGTAGVVSLEDIAATVFGEMEDEFEPPPTESPTSTPVKRTEDGAFVLSGDLSVRDWAELFGVEPARGQYDTLGGFVAHLLDRIPKKGDVARWGNVLFEVTAMRGRRVGQVRLWLEAEGSARAEEARTR